MNDWRAALQGRSIVLGDQAPWAGGALRAQALLQAGLTPRYFWQDLDAPWVETAERLHVCHGWPAYWSLACRYPYSACIPGWHDSQILNSCASPHGLQYLAGPRQHQSLAGVTQDAPLLALLRQMLQQEVAWASTLAQWRATPWDKIELPPSDDLAQCATACAARCGVREMERFSTLFAAEPPLLAAHLPPECFWHIDPAGRRWPMPQADTYAAPRALALVLEFAARGWLLACTSLPYLAQALALRERYLPGLRLPLLHIDLHWANGGLLQVLLTEYQARRWRRGKTAPMPEPAALARLDAYWSARPSCLSLQMLGGALQADFRVQEY
jgi:hypothetical protein